MTATAAVRAGPPRGERSSRHTEQHQPLLLPIVHTSLLVVVTQVDSRSRGVTCECSGVDVEWGRGDGLSAEAEHRGCPPSASARDLPAHTQPHTATHSHTQPYTHQPHHTPPTSHSLPLITAPAHLCSLPLRFVLHLARTLVRRCVVSAASRSQPRLCLPLSCTPRPCRSHLSALPHCTPVYHPSPPVSFCSAAVQCSSPASFLPSSCSPPSSPPLLPSSLCPSFLPPLFELSCAVWCSCEVPAVCAAALPPSSRCRPRRPQRRPTLPTTALSSSETNSKVQQPHSAHLAPRSSSRQSPATPCTQRCSPLSAHAEQTGLPTVPLPSLSSSAWLMLRAVVWCAACACDVWCGVL